MIRAAALLTLVLAALLAPTASAQDAIDRAAAALASDPVYVDPDAENAISPAEAEQLRARISERDAGPMYIAVLPESAARAAGGSAFAVARAIGERLDRQGTYAVVAGDDFEAGSTDVRGTPEQVDAALEAHGGEVGAATLLAFVDRMGAVRAGRDPDPGGGGGGGIGAAILIPLLALGAGALFLSQRGKRRAREAELAELKENVRDDLVALGDDIRALDLDVDMPGVDERAKSDYHAAVAAYQRAEERWELARHPDDFEPVGAALEEGRWAMASAKARLEGREPPERTPPCFFDPRHGPSSREVEWAPYGGAPRLVPACEADAQRVERGEDPEAREVLVGGQRMPYWHAGPMYAPFAGGFFAGGLLPALMVGTMLGGGFGGGWGAGDAHGAGDGGDGGDWGGGGFGGGDFGGGDFGGGGGDF